MQPDLADTLEAIARGGPRAFYEGPVAEQDRRRGARGRRADDARTTSRTTGRSSARRCAARYRGYDIVSMPPPSSGGVLLIEMLNVLEGFEMRARRSGVAASDDRGDGAPTPTARSSSAIRTSCKMPIAGPDLEALRRGAARRPSTASARRRRTSSRAGKPAAFESDNTTHYSVVDRLGNAVANTYTLNLSYGVGLVADGTGVLLNNELDDFAATPGAPNAFGLVG